MYANVIVDVVSLSARMKVQALLLSVLHTGDDVAMSESTCAESLHTLTVCFAHCLAHR